MYRHLLQTSLDDLNVFKVEMLINTSFPITD